MILKCFRYLRIWHLKCLIKRLFVIEIMPAPGSTPMSSKEGGWAQNQEFVLNMENPVTEQKNCPLPQLLPRPYPDCVQTGHRRIDCSALPRQGRLVPPSSFYTGNSVRSLGLAGEDWYCPGTFVPNDYGGTWGSCLSIKFLVFLIDSEATSFLLTQVTFIFLRSDGVWQLGW